MSHYTVLLLRPDYIADPYGWDTYLAHVMADGPNQAVVLAQAKALEADADGDNDGTDPTDYYPLFTCIGHHEDLTSGR